MKRATRLRNSNTEGTQQSPSSIELLFAGLDRFLALLHCSLLALLFVDFNFTV